MGLRCVRVYHRVGGTRRSPRGARMQRAGYVHEGLYGGLVAYVKAVCEMRE